MADNYIFKIGAYAILLDEKRRVLLGKRAKGIEVGKWSLIGGKLKENESPKDAVKRETKEEISIDFEPVFYRQIGGVNKVKKVKWLCSYFIGHIKSNEPLDNYEKSELSELNFFSKEELADLEIAFDHKRVLKTFFKDYSLGLVSSVRDKTNKDQNDNRQSFKIK